MKVPIPFTLKTSTLPTIIRSRISAPAPSARGSHVTSTDCLALVEHPATQKPRYMQGCALPLGADEVAIGAWVHSIPNASRSEEHTSELQSLMRTSYAVFCLKKKTKHNNRDTK